MGFEGTTIGYFFLFFLFVKMWKCDLLSLLSLYGRAILIVPEKRHVWISRWKSRPTDLLLFIKVIQVTICYQCKTFFVTIWLTLVLALNPSFHTLYEAQSKLTLCELALYNRELVFIIRDALHIARIDPSLHPYLSRLTAKPAIDNLFCVHRSILHLNVV